MNTKSTSAMPRTELCHYNEKAVYYRDANLVSDLLGKVSFVDVFMKQAFGITSTPAQQAIVNAVLVVLMEHGMTPSVIAARMVYSSSPENLQAGVAAGLLAVASQFVGTMEPAAELLATIVHEQEHSGERAAQAMARQMAQDYRARRQPIPGFGHHLHRPDDPRALALLDLARLQGCYGAHCQALELLATEVDAVAGRHITINATGAVAALLGDIGIPARMMRGFAVLSRAAGLIAHIAEEQNDPSGRFIWDLVDSRMTTPTGA